MRKFKHKITGYFVNQFEQGYKLDIDSFDSFFPKSLIEQGNDWEEVIEKKPLFVTEDGVEVFEEDEVYGVDYIFNYFCFVIINENAKENNKIFSTKKLAKEYIDLHKPKYSLKDVDEAFGRYEVRAKGRIIEKLKNLNK